MGSTNKKIYQRLATQVFLIPVGIVVLVGIVFVTNSFAETSPNRPNIIVIETDDQDFASIDAIRPDTGEEAFPNINWIMEDGVNFKKSYVSHGLCCPSRATLLTGQYDHNHQVITNTSPPGGYAALDHSNTLPVWLQNAGYHTALIGKYLNGYSDSSVPAIPPGWTTWFSLINGGVFKYDDFQIKTENGQLTQYTGMNNFQTDTLARRAARFIANREAGNAPFFMWLTFTNPHIASPSVGSYPYSTAAVAPRHLGVFNGYEPVLPPSFNEANTSDKPYDIRMLPLIPSTYVEEIKRRLRIRLESMLSVDEGVGLVKKALSRSNQLDNTIILFTSDNGWHQGEHRLISKKDEVYEESIRVPLFIRGPGIPKGESISKLVVNVDYAPTIAEIAGVTPGLDVDGRSLLPLIQNPAIPWRDSFLLENFWTDSIGGSFIGVHKGNQVYVEHEYGTLPDAPGPDDVELYVNDPYQLTSQQNNPRYASIKADLKSRLEVLRNCSGTNSASPTSCW